MCFLVSWKDDFPHTHTHTHVVARRKPHLTPKAANSPTSKRISFYAKIQGAIYCWACSTPWLSWHILGCMFLCGSFFSLRQLHSQNMGISDGWRKAFEVPRKPTKNAQLRDGVGSLWGQSGLLASLPLHISFPFTIFIAWLWCGMVISEWAPQPLLADTFPNYTPL